jgi:hypothetical protein
MWLRILGPCKGRPTLSLVRLSGTDDVTVCAPIDDLRKRLEAAASSWPDRHLFSLRPDEIEQATIHLDGLDLQLQRREAAFVLAGESQPIDVDAGNAALAALVSIHGALDEPPPAVAASAGPDFIVLRSSVQPGSENYEERVRVAPALPNGDRWLRRSADSAWLRIDADTLRAQVRQLAALPARTLDAGGPNR